MMRLFVVVTAFVCVLGAPRTLPRPRYPVGGRIVGGNDVSITQVPYQLALELYNSLYCGASIISADWVITAAHCVDGNSPSSMKFRSGSDRLEQGGELHQAVEIIANDQFDYFTIDFDIAIVRVGSPFKLSATTAVVALANAEPSAGTPANVTGWGTTTSGSGILPSNLQLVTVPIVDRKVCDAAYSPYNGITARMICAGVQEGGKDSCQGDSGGPMVAKGQLVGIVSWGVGCALPGFPGVYTNVANLRQWVKDNSGI